MSENYMQGAGSKPPKYETVAYQQDGKGIQTSLSAVLHAAVQERLTNLLLEQIHPLIHSQASSGIYRTAFVLVPSDVLKADDDGMKSEYYSSSVPDDELQTLSLTPVEDLKFVKIIRLSGEENGSRFLTQPQVIKLLRSQLVAHLCPEQAEAERRQAASTPKSPIRPQSGGEKKKSGIFSWKRSSKRNESQESQANEVTESCEDTSRGGGIDVAITVEEIVVRRPTSMGLLETRTGEGVVVHVNFLG